MLFAQRHDFAFEHSVDGQCLALPPDAALPRGPAAAKAASSGHPAWHTNSADALVFPASDGVAPMSPDNLSRDWARTCRRLALPLVMLHALRHTHASVIAAGLDVLTISRRLGHAKPTTTLNTYGHLFRQSDSGAAAAIEAAMGTAKGT